MGLQPAGGASNAHNPRPAGMGGDEVARAAGGPGDSRHPHEPGLLGHPTPHGEEPGSAPAGRAPSGEGPARQQGSAGAGRGRAATPAAGTAPGDRTAPGDGTAAPGEGGALAPKAPARGGTAVPGQAASVRDAALGEDEAVSPEGLLAAEALVAYEPAPLADVAVRGEVADCEATARDEVAAVRDAAVQGDGAVVREAAVRGDVASLGEAAQALGGLAAPFDLGVEPAATAAPASGGTSFLRRTGPTAIRHLLNILALYDPLTHRHSRRVAALACRLARRVGWQGEALRLLNLAGILHDTGKLAVDPRILHKPGKLNAEEWELIRRHPLVSEQLTRRVAGLPTVAAWVRSHHERWDGGGYPDGLAGPAIPPAARILAVADAFDAMVGGRPYHRQVITVDMALAEIERNAGRQFDPYLAEVFVAMMETARDAAAGQEP